jgi:hypothetical protein
MAAFLSKAVSRSSLSRCGEAARKAWYQPDQSSRETEKFMFRDSG